VSGPAVDDFAKEKWVASVARPVPMDALQWGELARPVAFVGVAVEALFEVLFETRPVPIAALQ
jgi:hypothetical protein